MNLPKGYKPLKGSEHPHLKTAEKLRPARPSDQITATLIVRRRNGKPKLRHLSDFLSKSHPHEPLSREAFAARYGADPKELEQVVSFAQSRGLQVLETNVARRSVVVRGSVEAVNRAFAITLHDYQSARGKYRSHPGTANVPAGIAHLVEAVVGLDTSKIPARHFSTARRRNPNDPANTRPLTPQQVATLYNFPPGDGAGQTIGIYEMETIDGMAGYTVRDLTDTMRAFGGGLRVPVPMDVAIDGTANSGVSDGETSLDITLASAVAQGAQIAVYFTGGDTQNIIHALQRMIHPGAGDPQPHILSISYGWGPDDPSARTFSTQAYTQIGKLFQDAANLSISVLVSSGDSGAFVESETKAQISYPAAEPWVIACGGTTIGKVNGTEFDEYVWNDVGAAGPGATGGGVSARFPVPDYQKAASVPKHNGTRRAGRGVPDIAGNASENSGYVQFINGRSQPVGGTSAVAPLYAGMIARINTNLGRPVGFINPFLYKLRGSAFRDIGGAPGPVNNSFGRVAGYGAGSGWDACTGLGSVNGGALQNGLLRGHRVK